MVSTLSSMKRTSGSTSGFQTSSSPPGFRNLIINGDMTIAQRGTSLAGITDSGGDYLVDRWKLDEVADSTLTMSQETLTSGDAYDDGFQKSLKVLVTTGDADEESGGALSNSVQLTQAIEARNLQLLNFGTATAKNLTLSFWYKSNVTGIHTVCIDKIDSTRATCPLEFTVSSADTWTKYTLNVNANAVIQGASAAIANDSGVGFRVMWGLLYSSGFQNGTNGIWVQNGTGSFSTSNQQNIMSTISNYVELTGVQLEVGSSATDFEHWPYDYQLHRCQRYCFLVRSGLGYCGGTTLADILTTFPVEMRAQPSVTQVDSTITIRDSALASITQSSASCVAQSTATTGSVTRLGNYSGLTQHRPCHLFEGSNNAFYYWSAEL